MSYHFFPLIPEFSNHLLSDRITQMENFYSRLTGEKPLADTPPYNLLQKDKQHYELTVSVPGFSEDEIDISVLKNQLTILGKQKDSEPKPSAEKEVTTCLHHGIRKKDFSLSFSLNHRVNILQAGLNKGLLTLQFTCDIPEQEKPKKIAISSENKAEQVIEHSNA